MSLYTFIFYCHISFLCLAGIGIVLADATAFGWLHGKIKKIDRRMLAIAHWIVALGLAGLIGTGLYLFWPQRNFLIGEPLFWLKMVFVVALVINSFFIEHFMHVATKRSFVSLARKERIPLMVSGAVSTLSWIGAFLIAITIF